MNGLQLLVIGLLLFFVLELIGAVTRPMSGMDASGIVRLVGLVLIMVGGIMVLFGIRPM
jgi:hypothetical protein